MVDDKKKHGMEDANRINVQQPYEVQYWTKELGIRERELIEAMEAVGTVVSKVRAYLKRKKKT